MTRARPQGSGSSAVSWKASEPSRSAGQLGVRGQLLEAKAWSSRSRTSTLPPSPTRNPDRSRSQGRTAFDGSPSTLASTFIRRKAASRSGSSDASAPAARVMSQTPRRIKSAAGRRGDQARRASRDRAPRREPRNPYRPARIIDAPNPATNTLQVFASAPRRTSSRSPRPDHFMRPGEGSEPSPCSGRSARRRVWLDPRTRHQAGIGHCLVGRAAEDLRRGLDAGRMPARQADLGSQQMMSSISVRSSHIRAGFPTPESLPGRSS